MSCFNKCNLTSSIRRGGAATPLDPPLSRLTHHHAEPRGEHAGMFDDTVARLQHALDLATLRTLR